MCAGLSGGAEGAIGLGERLSRADVVPAAGDPPRVYGHPRVEPFDKPAGLVGVVSRLEVLAHEPERLARVEVERDPGQRAARLLRLLLEVREPVVLVELDRVVLTDRLQVADVVDAE